jgi:hypothetical protein
MGEIRGHLGVWGLSSTHRRSLGRFIKGPVAWYNARHDRPESGWCCVVYLSRLRGCRTFFRLRTMGRCRLGYHSKRGSMSHVCIIVWFLRYDNANKHATGIPAGGREKQRQSVGGDPGGYLQQSLSRDRQRSGDVNMISID